MFVRPSIRQLKLPCNQSLQCKSIVKIYLNFQNFDCFTEGFLTLQHKITPKGPIVPPRGNSIDLEDNYSNLCNVEFSSEFATFC